MMPALISFCATAVGFLAALILVLRLRNTSSPSPHALDPITRVFNVLLSVGYVCFSPILWFLALVSESYPEEGILCVLGWIVAGAIWILPAAFGTGIGLSVLLRKKGRGRAAFIIQFAGACAVALSFALYAIFVGTLLTPLN